MHGCSLWRAYTHQLSDDGMDPMRLSPASPRLPWLQDLIKNHLVMALYNHAAIWRGRTDRMPQGFFTNGHVLVDGEKMSKSAGNFITLLDGIKRWSADAYVFHELSHHTSVLNQACCADVRVVCVALHRCRITLALAGDSLNDANFECHTADSMVQRLVRGTLIVCCCCCALHGVRSPGAYPGTCLARLEGAAVCMCCGYRVLGRSWSWSGTRVS